MTDPSKDAVTTASRAEAIRNKLSFSFIIITRSDFMKDNEFRDVRISLYLLAFLLLFALLFYFFASMFSSMGFKALKASTDSVDDNRITIIIDAGHGGEDPGAVANGVVEKDLNLEVALLLEGYFSSAGYKTVLTRNDDSLLYGNESVNKKRHDLINRVKIAEDHGDDAIFISIHMNKFSASFYKGLQTFYSENSSDSALLAESIQQSSYLLTPDNNRKIKSGMGTIYILENIQIPAVLVECGFISNPDEALLLSDPVYQRQLALSIYLGACDYIKGAANEN